MKQKKQCGVAKPLIHHGLSAALLKKAICAVLPDSGPHTVHRVNKKENNYLTSVLSDICDSNEKDSNEAMFNLFHPLYRDHHPIDSREWSGSPYKTPE